MIQGTSDCDLFVGFPVSKQSFISLKSKHAADCCSVDVSIVALASLKPNTFPGLGLICQRAAHENGLSCRIQECTVAYQ